MQNPWGIAHSPNGPFWVSDNDINRSGIHNGADTKQGLVVAVPSSPTSTVLNIDSTGFNVGTIGTVSFTFADDNGTVPAWNRNTASIDGVSQSSVVDTGPSGLSFNGLCGIFRAAALLEGVRPPNRSPITLPAVRFRLLVTSQLVGTRRTLFVMATRQEYGPALQARIDPLMCGVGPIEASLTMGIHLQRIRDRGEPLDLVVSLGSAGSRICPLGTVHQVSEVSWRDIDATRLGVPKGVTPFLDCPARIPIPTPLPGIPAATLSTGGTVLGPDDYEDLGSEMADMETFAVLRACERFGVPMLGLRGISDGPDDLREMSDWTDRLDLIDTRLAEAVDMLIAHISVAGEP